MLLIRNPFRFIKLAMLPVFIAASISSRGTEIEIGASTGRTVSPYLTGINTVYSHEFMDTWKDRKKITDLKKAGISCLRYPGGHVVSFWDWEFPFHSPYQNFWKPAYIKALTSEKKAELKQKNGHRMEVNDYFKICAETGIEPIMGINMFQGYKFNRLEDSIAKATRLVAYSKKQIPRVKYYFLDNEAGHQPQRGNHIPIDDYIRLIPAYSKAIKAVQPDAKLIVNPIHWGRVRDMIKKAGEHFDIVDNHWYYCNRKWGLFYIKDWRNEKKSRQFEQRMNQFKSWKKETGHDHLRMSVLEWNLGPARGAEGSDLGSYLFQGLIQANMLMHFIDHDIFMAAVWPLMWSSSKTNKQGGYRSFFDPKTGKASSSKYIFRWFSMAGNGTVLGCSSPLSEGVHAAAVLREDGKTILVYILNKSEESRNVTVKFRKPVSAASAESFQEGSDVDDVVVKELPIRTADKAVSFKMTDTSLVFLKVGIE